MTSHPLSEKPMVIVIPSYNNIAWYERNLASVFMQDYHNYRVIYIDDCSTDGTAEAVKEYVQEWEQEDRICLERNDSRSGAMANLYGAIHGCSDEEIIVLLDGDDWLFSNHVLKKLNEAYSSGEVWFTHGSTIEYPSGWLGWNEPIPSDVIARKAYRKEMKQHPTHLRTFYAWLFKKIKLQDFLHHGAFLKMSWDMAIMYPLLEMAEERHAFIRELNHVYNAANPSNDHKIDRNLQQQLDQLIRSRTPYKRLIDPKIDRT